MTTWKEVVLTRDEMLLACAEFAAKKFGARHVDDGRIWVGSHATKVHYRCSIKISLDPTIKDRA